MKLKRITSLPKLPRRPREAHKGNFGRVLVVGGSRGMVGAVALTAEAALRGGAGLVTFAAPRAVQLTIAAICPCATSLPLSCDPGGSLAAKSVREMLDAAGRCDVLAVGPGMAVGAGQKNLVRAALEQDRPLVLDADGLNNLAALDHWPAMRRCATVLTPHPGELARLTGMSMADIQADRENVAAQTVRRWVAGEEGKPLLVLALKGAGTVVTDGHRVYVNDTGNPGMATGGSGDVLTGLAAALIGQGLEAFEAACLAVYCHGRAADLAAEKMGEISLTASDLLEYLPPVLKNAQA